MIVWSDAHHHNFPEHGRPWLDGCNTRLRDSLDVMTSVFQLAAQLNERTILFLGDFFHQWQNIHTPVYRMVTRHLYGMLASHPDIRLIMLVGNHDMTDKTRPDMHTLSAYAGHPSILVVDESTAIEELGRPCVLIPYNENPEYFIHHASRLWKEDAWIFGHLDIVGAQSGIDGYVATDGVRTEVLDRYAGGVFGHYHMPQGLDDEGRFHYVGSPAQQHYFNRGENHHGVIRLIEHSRLEDTIDLIPLMDAPRFVDVPDWNDPEFHKHVRRQDYHHVHVTRAEAADVQRALRAADLQFRLAYPEVERKEQAPIQRTSGSDVFKLWAERRARMCDTEVAMLMSYGQQYIEEIQ